MENSSTCNLCIKELAISEVSELTNREGIATEDTGMAVLDTQKKQEINSVALSPFQNQEACTKCATTQNQGGFGGSPFRILPIGLWRLDPILVPTTTQRELAAFLAENESA